MKHELVDISSPFLLSYLFALIGEHMLGFIVEIEFVHLTDEEGAYTLAYKGGTLSLPPERIEHW